MNGQEIINKTTHNIPNSPGVYRMMGENNSVLYVGKAKNLKKRLQIYGRKSGHNNRITKMISLIKDVEFTITENEEDALLLEVNLIKLHKPKYNVLMRDDKSFPYIHFTKNFLPTRIKKHRGKKKEEGDYFGPYAMEGSVFKAINILQKTFLLRTCSDSYFKNRERPCLLFQIKKCSGPCTNEISKKDYEELVEEAKFFFKGRSDRIKKKLANKMRESSDELDYEKAKYYRDRIIALSNLGISSSINPKNLKEADVFAIYQNSKIACIQVFFFRSWKNLGNKPFFINNINGLDRDEILESFISQFYSNKTAPKLILVSNKFRNTKIIEKVLSQKYNRHIRVMTPQKGERKLIIEHALENSKQALKRHMKEIISNFDNIRGLKEVFNLEKIPRRIEVYDNSHIQGSHSTGAMIVADKEGFKKNQYRKFNIKNAKSNDDFGMMYEMLYRRFLRLKNKNPDDLDFPNLIIIDGGTGQVSMVKKALKDAKIEKIEIVGISKGKKRNDGNETFHLSNKEKIILKSNDPVLFYLQRLRDEAHRFAIGTHRLKRNKAIMFNPLDEIPGIGTKRKRALLNSFGSAKAVGKAKILELTHVEGISKNTAENIYNWFNELN